MFPKRTNQILYIYAVYDRFYGENLVLDLYFVPH